MNRRATSRPAYLNGIWLDANELRLSVDDYGLLMGVAVAERLRTVAGRVFRLEDHIVRMRRSLAILGWDAAGLSDRVSQVVAEYALRIEPLAAPGDDWSIAVFVTPGSTPDAQDPTVCVYGGPLPFDRWAHQYATGATLAVSSVRQTPASCWPPDLKCRSRMHYYLADRDAASRYPGSRPVLLDQEGYVTESSTANVVLFERGVGLVTPPLTDVLPGVSQQTLFELADELGVERLEQSITPDRLAAADEVFLTSTSVAMLPAVSLDGRPLGSGVPGPEYKRFLRAWSERIGLDIAAQANAFAVR